MPIKLDVLALAAHPDDVEISASGIMIKHKAEGYATGIVDLTAGELGTRGNAEIRARECAKANEIMKLDVRENLNMRDGFFEITEENLLKIVKVIRKYRPEVLLINAPSDRHPDHGRAHEMELRASFLSGLSKIQSVEEGESQLPWRPKNIYAYIQDHYHEPSLIMDVSPYWEDRMKALMAFSSQFYDPNSKEPQTPISTPDFLDFIEGRARQLGRTIQAKYAEGLIAIRPIGAKNLLDLL